MYDGTRRIMMFVNFLGSAVGVGGSKLHIGGTLHSSTQRSLHHHTLIQSKRSYSIGWNALFLLARTILDYVE
jgi:hypothetical protein